MATGSRAWGSGDGKNWAQMPGYGQKRVFADPLGLRCAMSISAQSQKHIGSCSRNNGIEEEMGSMQESKVLAHLPALQLKNLEKPRSC